MITELFLFRIFRLLSCFCGIFKIIGQFLTVYFWTESEYYCYTKCSVVIQISTILIEVHIGQSKV